MAMVTAVVADGAAPSSSGMAREEEAKDYKRTL
jgi:hypothetical protein